MTVNMTDYAFQRARDARGHQVRGLWQRNGRCYACMRFPGKKTSSMVPLVDENNQPVQTIAQAVLARNRLIEDRRKGKTPAPRITPPFDEFCKHYLKWLETTEAKSKLTIARERSALKHCAKHFGCLRISAIAARNIDDYIFQRKQQGMSSRNLNVQIVALRNLFAFAKRQGHLKHDLPTQNTHALPYKSPKRVLISDEAIEALCAEATRRRDVDPEVTLVGRIVKDYPQKGAKGIDWQRAWKEHPEWKARLAPNRKARQATYHLSRRILANPELTEGEPVHVQGQMLADWVRLMAYSGARYQAAISAQWKHVDWTNRQLHLFTKFEKEVIVDFNPKLEAHLKDMHRRRVPVDTQGTLSPFLSRVPPPRGLNARPHCQPLQDPQPRARGGQAPQVQPARFAALLHLDMRHGRD